MTDGSREPRRLPGATALPTCLSACPRHDDEPGSGPLAPRGAWDGAPGPSHHSGAWPLSDFGSRGAAWWSRHVAAARRLSLSCCCHAQRPSPGALPACLHTNPPHMTRPTYYSLARPARAMHPRRVTGSRQVGTQLGANDAYWAALYDGYSRWALPPPDVIVCLSVRGQPGARGSAGVERHDWLSPFLSQEMTADPRAKWPHTKQAATTPRNPARPGQVFSDAGHRGTGLPACFRAFITTTARQERCIGRLAGLSQATSRPVPPLGRLVRCSRVVNGVASRAVLCHHESWTPFHRLGASPWKRRAKAKLLHTHL